MPDAKISELTAIPAVAEGDLLPIVDVSDLSHGAGGSTRKVTASELRGAGKTLAPLRWVLGAGTPMTTGTGKTARLTVPYAGTIKHATIDALTGPSGQALIVDINLDGTSIWATNQANRLQIAAGSTSGSRSSFDTTAVAAGQKLTIDVDQVGNPTAGQDVVVELWILLDNPA